jgi:hypothetical protein
MVPRANKEAEMSMINDYSYQVMTDQRERDLARLAERNRRVRLALSGRVSWWQKMLERRRQRIAIATEHPAQHGIATPQHRVAH